MTICSGSLYCDRRWWAVTTMGDSDVDLQPIFVEDSQDSYEDNLLIPKIESKCGPVIVLNDVHLESSPLTINLDTTDDDTTSEVVVCSSATSDDTTTEPEADQSQVRSSNLLLPAKANNKQLVKNGLLGNASKVKNFTPSSKSGRFQCNFCKCNYSRRDNLHLHIRKNHPKRFFKPASRISCAKMLTKQLLARGKKGNFRCRHCEKCYTRIDNLRVHVRRSHPNVDVDYLYAGKKNEDRIVEPKSTDSDCDSIGLLQNDVSMEISSDATSEWTCVKREVDGGFLLNQEFNTEFLLGKAFNKDVELSRSGVNGGGSTSPGEHRNSCINTVSDASVIGCLRLVGINCMTEGAEGSPETNYWLLHPVKKTPKVVTKVKEEELEVYVDPATGRNVCRVTKKLECEICYEKFAFQIQLNAHCEQHKTENGMMCLKCHKCFRGKTKLIRHMASHTGERNFACRVCGKAFIYKDNMIRHQKNCEATMKEVSPKSPKAKDVNIHGLDSNWSKLQNRHECNACGQKFLCEAQLKIHIKKHETKLGFKCLKCFKCFPSRHKLYRHIVVHTKEKRYKCPHCGEAFLYQDYKNKHMEICTMKKKSLLNSTGKASKVGFECRLCQRNFSSHGDMLCHMNKIHGKKKSKFLESASTSEVVEIDSSSSAEQPSYNCSICAKPFRYKSKLARHELIHQHTKSLKCWICKSNFAHTFALKEHMMRVHKVGNVSSSAKSRQCTLCKRMFSTIFNLIRHKKNVHFNANTTMKRSSNMETCAVNVICDNKVQSKSPPSSLSKLSLWNSKSVILQCRFCDENFMIKDELKDHVEDVHSKVAAENTDLPIWSSLRCAFCNKMYCWPSAMRKHMMKLHPKIYLREIPSTVKCVSEEAKITISDSDDCQVITSKVSTNDKATDRMKKHVCGACGDKFTSEAHLKTHEKKHNSKNGYRCLKCVRSFPTRHKLYRHIVVHTKEKRFQCHQCDKAFRYQDSKNKHMETCPKAMTVTSKTTSTDGNNTTIRCTLCDKTFTRISNLHRHTKHAHSSSRKALTVTPASLLKCFYCERTFTRKDNLHVHIRNLHPKKSLKKSASATKTASSQKGQTNVTLPTNSSSPTSSMCHECDMCCKVFILEGHIKRHRVKHRQGKLYKCLQCSKTFDKKSRLVKHCKTLHL